MWQTSRRPPLDGCVSFATTTLAKRGLRRICGQYNGPTTAGQKTITYLNVCLPDDFRKALLCDMRQISPRDDVDPFCSCMLWWIPSQTPEDWCSAASG